MQYNERFKIAVVSDFNNFKNNMYSLFSMLPIKGVLVTIIDSIADIKLKIKEKKPDLIIINKAGYSQEEIYSLFELEANDISVIIMIDQYFKYKPLFLNFENGFITIRRPISINKFLEILKISLFANFKKKKSNNDIKKIRTLEMAKSFLVIYENMYEEDSHKYLETNAMNERITLYDESLKIVIKYLYEREDIKYEYKNQ